MTKNYTKQGIVVLLVVSLLHAPVAFGSDQDEVGPSSIEPPAAFAWGDFDDGKLGDGGKFARLSPVPVKAPEGVGQLTDVVQLAPGQFHTVALRGDGSVWAWGDNRQHGHLGDGTSADRTLPVPVVGPGGNGLLEDIVEIAVGERHNLALKADRTVWSWGHNQNGQLGDGSTTLRSSPVQVVDAQGNPLQDVVQIAAGNFHSLALDTTGKVWAWGRNSDGQLGDDSTTQRSGAVVVKGPGGTGDLDGISMVDAGARHTVALAVDGTVWAWGNNDNGRLGDGTTDESLTPVQVMEQDNQGPLSGVTQLSVGESHNLVLRSNGEVWAWGLGSNGQLGDGTTESSPFPVPVTGPGGQGVLDQVIEVAAGRQSLALTSEYKVWAWGTGRHGALGDGIDYGVSGFSETPVQVVGLEGDGILENATAISANGWTGTAVLADSTAWRWGDDPQHDRLGPVPVMNKMDWSETFEQVIQVDAGRHHSVALRSDGTVWTWGSNQDGQLGDETFEDRILPVQVVGPGGIGHLTDIVQVAAGRSHSMALHEDGTVWAWGDNSFGTLGDGDWVDRNVPVQVVSSDETGALTDITQIAGGGHWFSAYSMAVGSDGTLWGWGDDFRGQLGAGLQQETNVPVRTKGPGGVGFLEDVVEVATGGTHTIAVKADGTVWSWGENWDGRLGDGTSSDRMFPVQVVGPSGVGVLDDVVTVAAGDQNGYAVKNDSTVWSWGANWAGQTGDGSFADSATPVQTVDVGGSGVLKDVVEVVAGEWHAMALRFDGTMVSWGDNSAGQLGVREDTYWTWASETPMIVRDVFGDAPLQDVRAIAAGSVHVLAVVGGSVPSQPLNLTAVSGPGVGEITLSWTEPQELGFGEFLGYQVQAGPAPGDYDTLVDVGVGEGLTWTESALAPGTARFYEVTAVSGLGAGDATTTSSTTFPADDPPPLPEGRSATSAAWEGQYAYVFGGRDVNDEATDSIIRFDPVTNNATVLDTKLTTARLGTSAVWAPTTGTGATGSGFIFGGLGEGADGDMQVQHCHGSCRAGAEILEYDPFTDSIEVREPEFDGGRFATSSVWDPTNQVAYIFGGFSSQLGSQTQEMGAQHCHGSCRVGEEIWVFDPVADTLELHEENLPVALAATSVIWHDEEEVAYIFGGYHDADSQMTEDFSTQHCHGSCRAAIIRFDPNAEVQVKGIEVLPVQLPGDRWNTSAVFDGQYAYIFGGQNETGPNDEIVRFDPQQESVTTVGSLPTRRSQSSAIFDGSDAYVFGGLEQDNAATDEIVRFTPTAPQSLNAQNGEQPGSIELSWQTPASEGGGSIEAYRIYRSQGPEGPYALIGSLTGDLGASSTEPLTFMDSGLGLLDERFYRVSAVNPVGEGPASALALGRTFDPHEIYLEPGGPSLQEAVDVVAPGGTIHLAPGTYFGGATLDVAVTLIAGTQGDPGPTGLASHRPVIVGSLETRAGLTLRDLALKPGPGDLPLLETVDAPLVEVANTTFSGSGQSGTRPMVKIGYASQGAVRVLFEENTLVGATQTGLRISGDNPDAELELTGNIFEENRVGTVVADAVFASLRAQENRWEGNTDHGVLIEEAAGEVVFRFNQFAGNGIGLGVSASDPVDARYNWWGNPGGPLLGDQAQTSLVDHTPWCLQADCGITGQVESLGLL